MKWKTLTWRKCRLSSESCWNLTIAQLTIRKHPIAPKRRTLLASMSVLPSINFCAMTSPVESVVKVWIIWVRSGRLSNTWRYEFQRRRVKDIFSFQNSKNLWYWILNAKEKLWSWCSLSLCFVFLQDYQSSQMMSAVGGCQCFHLPGVPVCTEYILYRDAVKYLDK